MVAMLKWIKDDVAEATDDIWLQLVLKQSEPTVGRVTAKLAVNSEPTIWYIIEPTFVVFVYYIIF